MEFPFSYTCVLFLLNNSRVEYSVRFISLRTTYIYDLIFIISAHFSKLQNFCNQYLFHSRVKVIVYWHFNVYIYATSFSLLVPLQEGYLLTSFKV
jgi:hypothetical protein